MQNSSGTGTLEKILIVEDDVLSQEVIAMFLSGLYEPSITGSGEEAVKLLKENNFPLVLLDINLGSGMTGIDVVKMIRKMHDKDKSLVIATTAFVMESNKREFLSAGFDDYLAKPFSRRELLAVIDKNIKKRSNFSAPS